MPSMYDNYKRKTELIAYLKELQDFYLKASDNLDQKAWNVLSVTSATFGIVSAIMVSLLSDKTPAIFWIGLLFILILYLLQVRQVLQAIKPMTWHLVPGALPETRYDTLLMKYIADGEKPLTDEEYADQLIADFAGHLDRAEHKTYIPGSLFKIELNNKLKAKHIQQATRLLGFIITGLIMLSFIAASGR